MAGRPDLPRHVAIVRFHLDDIGAVVAEHLGGIGPHQHGRHVDDLDAFQWSHGSAPLPALQPSGLHCCEDQVTAGPCEDQGAPSVWPYARDGGYFFGGSFFDLASRSRVRRSSSSFCWLSRSAMRDSFRSPEAAAACSINCRMLSSRILIRSLSSASDNELSLLMVHAPGSGCRELGRICRVGKSTIAPCSPSIDSDILNGGHAALCPPYGSTFRCYFAGSSTET